MIHPAPYLTALSLPSDAPAAGPRERSPAQAGAGRTSSLSSGRSACSARFSQLWLCSCPGPGDVLCVVTRGCSACLELTVLSVSHATSLRQHSHCAVSGHQCGLWSPQSPCLSSCLALDVTFSVLWITLTTRTGPERPEPEPESPLGPTLSKKAKKVGCDRAERDQSVQCGPAVSGSVSHRVRERTQLVVTTSSPASYVSVTSEQYSEHPGQLTLWLTPTARTGHRVSLATEGW